MEMVISKLQNSELRTQKQFIWNQLQIVMFVLVAYLQKQWSGYYILNWGEDVLMKTIIYENYPNIAKI